MKFFGTVIFFLCLFLNGISVLFSQPIYNNCSKALEICPNNSLSITNIGANKTFCTDCEDDFSFCFAAENTIWLKFTTNEQGGNVQLDFSSIVFQNAVGQATQLQATLIRATAPCSANSYTQIGTCISNATGNFSLSANSLPPNTLFYVVINGDKSGVGITKAAEATFNLLLSGTGVDRISPTISLTPSTLSSCKDEIVTFSVHRANCTDSSDLSWFINGILVAKTKDTIYKTSALKTGDVVSVSTGCFTLCPIQLSTSTASFLVNEVQLDAGNDIHLKKGETTQLQGVTAAPIFSWSPEFALSSSSILNPIAIPTTTTTYTLTAEENGCTDYDYVTIFVEQDLIIPTTFSPNNDGINDIFEIVGIENYPNNYIRIYDRWGQEVFQKTGYSLSKAWKGESDGKEVATGVYFYTIELRDDKDQLRKGTITIIR